MGITVMGIDPGLTRMGVGFALEASGSMSQLWAGTLETSASDPLPARLASLDKRLRALISAHDPDEVAIERVFLKLNARSASSALMAAGVAICAAGSSGLSVDEYSPAQVKQAVTGSGSADKGQVASMVSRLLGGFSLDAPDAMDALAVAICHLNSRRISRLSGAAG